MKSAHVSTGLLFPKVFLFNPSSPCGPTETRITPSKTRSRKQSNHPRNRSPKQTISPVITLSSTPQVHRLRRPLPMSEARGFSEFLVNISKMQKLLKEVSNEINPLDLKTTVHTPQLGSCKRSSRACRSLLRLDCSYSGS